MRFGWFLVFVAIVIFSLWLSSFWLAKASRAVQRASTLPTTTQTALASDVGVRSTADRIAHGKLLTAKHGCIQCHTDSGERTMGPSFLGLYGSIIKYDDGSGAVVDEANVRESLKEPGKRIMDGFSPAMPSFDRVLSEDEILSVIAYLKSLQ